MAGRGGWFKIYDDLLDDPKIARLNDLEFRVFVAALCFANRSPARLRRGGYLYHSVGFPVEPLDFARKIGAPEKAVAEAVTKLCQIGDSASLLVAEGPKAQNGPQAYRVRNWRRRQDGETDDGDSDVPEPCQNGDSSVPEPCQNGAGTQSRSMSMSTSCRREGGPGGGEPAPARPTWAAESAALRAIPGYPFDERKDRALMDALAEAYDVDLAQEIRKLRSWLAAKGLLPLRGQAKPRARIRKWMENADRFAAAAAARREEPIEDTRPG